MPNVRNLLRDWRLKHRLIAGLVIVNVALGTSLLAMPLGAAGNPDPCTDGTGLDCECYINWFPHLIRYCAQAIDIVDEGCYPSDSC
jgi:hypothetical protein